MGTTKEFEKTGVLNRAHGFGANCAAEAIIIQIQPNGDLCIESTLDEKKTIDLLDRSMEAIDGMRFPPEGK